MDLISQKYQKPSLFLEAGFAAFCVVMAGYNFFCSTPYYVFLSFLGLALSFVPRIIEKVLKLKADYLLRFATHLYILLTYGIGMIFNGYDKIPYYDKVMHTLTGVVFGLCGLIAFAFLKPGDGEKKDFDREEFPVAAVFSLGFATVISVGWEIVEFVINLVLHNDPQHVLDTGVTDTMMDMIVCLIGSLIFWIPMYRYCRSKKGSLLMDVFESFRQTNLLKHREKQGGSSENRQ